jgi:hypothetical protein
MLMLPILICGAIAAGSAPASCDKAHERLILEPSGVASLQRAQYQQFQQPYQQFSPNQQSGGGIPSCSGYGDPAARSACEARMSGQAQSQQRSVSQGNASANAACNGYQDPAARRACLDSLGSAQQQYQQYQQYSGSQQAQQPGAPNQQAQPGQQAQSGLSQQQQLLQQLQQNMGVGNGAGGANGQQQAQPQQRSQQNLGQGQGQGQGPSDAELRMRMMLMQRSMGFGGIFGGPNGIISGFMKGNGSSNSSCSGYNEYAARRACENGDSWAAQRIEGHESSGSEYDWYNR